MEPNKPPVAGDTVQNDNGALPANPSNSHDINGNQPAQGNGDGTDSFFGEAERLIKEAREKAETERIAREKAENKIVQMKRDGASSDEIAKAFAEFQTETRATLERIEKERMDDNEATKIVVASLLKKSKEADELKAALASGKGIPNISSQNIPTPPVAPTHTTADAAILKWQDKINKKK